MPKYRLDKISEEVKKAVSEIIRTDIKDPRITALTSVVDAQVTPDLKFAKIFISILGNDEETAATLKGLNSASGYIRRELGQRVKLRYSPEVHFELDKSIEHGAHIMKLLHDINKREEGENP